VTEIAPYAKDNLCLILVFCIAIAQALTILLTIRRERDVKELREFVDHQRLHNVKLTAWLAGNRSAASHRLKKPKREKSATGEPKANNNKLLGPPKSPVAPSQPRIAENEAAWQRDILAGLRTGLKSSARDGSAKTPNGLPDTIRQNPEKALERTEKAIELLREETDKAREDANLHGISSAKIR